MIYLTEGNTPLNEAYNDEIVHLGNNTYQLTFRFPTSDTKWELLKEETFLTADDLHGEQDFYIFEVEKQQGYIQVYANQVISLLNNYIVSSIEVDRVSGTRVLSAFAGSITRANPFSFFSDIDDRHTLNIKDKNAMEVLAKGKHSILGQWGGDMVRNGYNLRLLKNGGSENESLFMYKKNLSSYQHKTSTKSLKTRITFKTTVKGEGENAVDHDYMVVIDSPLLGNYSQIYEDVVEVNDQDVTDEASLIEYGKQYFRTSMCDMLEDNLEISVVGQSDVAVQMFDVVSFYHEWYGLDVRKKITKYTYSPMAKLLKSIGFGTFQSSLANAIGGIVNDAVLNESRNLHQIFEERLKKEIANADRAFDAEFFKREKTITDAIELAKAKAEEVKQELSDTINQRFNSFDNGPLKEAKRKAEEALRNAGASSSLAQESKRIGLDSVARLEAFKSQTTSAQTALSGDLDALKRTIVNDIRPKQAQVEAEIAKQVEALVQTKKELAGASTLLAQEAKRIELDSVARLEAFKSQTTSAQTALSGDLDALKRTIANDIRPKQAQAEAEIAKQVEALSRTKNELAGVKSAQATYEETTTRRLSELTNLANGKASKSELTQTAEELASRIASVQASGRNLFLNSLFKQDIPKTGIWTTSTYTATIDSESKYLGHKALKIIGLNPSGRDGGNPKVTYPALGQFGKVIPGSTTNQDVTISFYAKANKNGIMLRSRLGNIGYKTGNVTLSTEIKRYVVHIPKDWTNESKQTTNEWLFNFNQEGTVWIWMPKFEISDVDTSYSEAPEDVESQISTVESTFKQRADSLDAGVNRLTEGLRTKVDISALNVTAENIRQSVKSLETDTQNKLNQKLSQAEFEVRAGSIRQEILNATKDKASKSELTQTAEELASKIASVQVGGRNYIRGTKRMMLARGLWASGTFRPSGAGTAKTIDVSDSPATGFDKAIRLTSSNARDQIGIAQDGFHISQGTYTMSCWVKGRRGQKVKLQTYWQVNDNSGISPIFTLKDENWTKLSFTSARNRAGVASIGYVYLVNAEVGEYLDVLAPQLEDGSLATSSKEAPEDIEGQISTVESTFKQRANSLDAGVRSLTEGLRTKVDISSLNVTAENIRQSVKRLETDTQNKLNQKLSQAEFEVRAGSIRQEIL
ncbi:phage tail spike protein, partial [Streptococcus pneumoniae]|uniref:phage tail spike protein n=1 Tax=Streptococcus pneumoniae TaxID=1313 RepID=UPI000B0ABAE9